MTLRYSNSLRRIYAVEGTAGEEALVRPAGGRDHDRRKGEGRYAGGGNGPGKACSDSVRAPARYHIQGDAVVTGPDHSAREDDRGHKERTASVWGFRYAKNQPRRRILKELFPRGPCLKILAVTVKGDTEVIPFHDGDVLKEMDHV